MRYRKPDRTEEEKHGFTTVREAKLYLSMVTLSKSKGEHIDPSSGTGSDVRGQLAAIQASTYVKPSY